MTSHTRSRYSLHPGFARERAFEAKLPEKTGKTLEEWVAVIKGSGMATRKERVAWLKSDHGLGGNYAAWLAERADGEGGAESYDPESLVEAMYSGSKAHLLPLYRRLLDLCFGLGEDVKACPCKTMVPLYRKHVFAQIKPTTNTRIDFGLALGDTGDTGRLIDTGGFAKGDRITHRIPVCDEADIDDELREWLAKAYARDA